MTLVPKDRRDALAGTGEAGEADSSRFAQTVDRSLVHRASIAEVYVTDYASEGDRFTVWAQWPRAHTLYCPGGRYHPTLLTETMRQAVLAVCHGLLDVPQGTRFVMSSITADGLDQLPPVGPHPTQVRLDLTRTPGPGNSRSGWQMRIHLGDHTTLAGAGALVLLTTRQYARVRHGQADRVRSSAPGRPTSPERVGREHPADVCLAQGPPGVFGLHVDQNHPIFYDHQLDHVPGALLIEAALQRAYADHPGFHARSIDTQFHAFLEPDQYCAIDCTLTPGHTDQGLLIQFRQERVVKTTIRLVSPPTDSSTRTSIKTVRPVADSLRENPAQRRPCRRI